MCWEQGNLLMDAGRDQRWSEQCGASNTEMAVGVSSWQLGNGSCEGRAPGGGGQDKDKNILGVRACAARDNWAAGGGPGGWMMGE